MPYGNKYVQVSEPQGREELRTHRATAQDQVRPAREPQGRGELRTPEVPCGNRYVQVWNPRGAGNCAPTEPPAQDVRRPPGTTQGRGELRAPEVPHGNRCVQVWNPRGAGNRAPPSDPNGNRYAHPYRPQKRKRRRPAGNSSGTGSGTASVVHSGHTYRNPALPREGPPHPTATPAMVLRPQPEHSASRTSGALSGNHRVRPFTRRRRSGRRGTRTDSRPRAPRRRRPTGVPAGQA